jgi:hypothetical protein
LIEGNIYSETTSVVNTRTDTAVDAEVAEFREGDNLIVYVANEKISMHWNGRVYVGNMFGMELTTSGPTLIRKVRGNF